MLPMLVAVALNPSLSMTLHVTPSIRQGSAVVATVWVENLTDHPLVVVKPKPSNYILGLNWTGKLSRKGKPMVRVEASPMTERWSAKPTIGNDGFLTLGPHQRAEIYRERFAKYVVSGRGPSMMVEAASERAASAKQFLPPGPYEIGFTYEFTPGFDESERHLDQRQAVTPPQSLTPKARSLYEKAWSGTAKASATFQVTS